MVTILSNSCPFVLERILTISWACVRMIIRLTDLSLCVQIVTMKNSCSCVRMVTPRTNVVWVKLHTIPASSVEVFRNIPKVEEFHRWVRYRCPGFPYQLTSKNYGK
jgi:hypothetical protein